MSLTKRGKYYWIDLCIGKQRFRSSLKTTNKLEALDRYKEKKEELVQEHLKKKIKFNDFCEKYLEWARSSKPASTPREAQRLGKIQDFFNGLEIVFLDEITAYHIEQLKAALKEGRLTKKDKDGKLIELSRATVNRYLQILRGLFYKAIDWEIYSGPNPLKRVRFYKENPQVKALTQAQVNKIVKAAQEISQAPQSPLQKAFYDLVLLAINTGMRKSEILNLKWPDLNGNEITVKGKGGRVRTVPVNSTAAEILARQKRGMDYIFDIPNRDQADLLRRTV
ncbi:MAG: tyrosine-type recombinase/integrase, partial [Candidatus Aenigmatarchaeota archaeon]